MDRHLRVKELFLACGEREEAEQAAFLSAKCAEDPELQAEVEGMLAFERADPGFLARPAYEEWTAEDAPLEGEPDESRDTRTDPVERPAMPPSFGTYELLSELAHGGMGIVLRGRDRQFGREIALKVLREELADRPDAVERFVEEAQICGQLQHPGIVPIYEFGNMPDARPFFAMKLIEGRTLADLLAEPARSDANRHRWNEIFEAVCQTIAYAHHRGVIHRDLKPSNVMVGAFGEVQVVDWGIAKVLGGAMGPPGRPGERSTAALPVETRRSSDSSTGSRSLSGSVLGTPAYMPREQALGDIEHLDARTDVFALGAILCELLTGAPPHTGSRTEVLEAARCGDLRDAERRLSVCVADQELVDLARECLAVDKELRPVSAEVVAHRMQSYLTSVEARAQRALVEAAESRVKVAQERRARRLTGALALSVVSTFVVLGGGWTYLRAQRTERERRTSENVSAALMEAERMRGEERWDEALDATHRARAFADAGEATADLRSRLSVTADAVEGEAAAAVMRTQLEHENRALLTALEEVRRPEGTRLYPADWAAVDREFSAAFAKIGVQFDGADSDTLTAQLAARGIDEQIAAALDDWASARSSADDSGGASQLGELAKRLDLDPRHAMLRAALDERDLSALRTFVQKQELAALPAPTLGLLGRALRLAGARDAALEVLRVARRSYPSDFVLAMSLARALVMDSTAAEEAARHYEAALALRPGSIEVRHELGRVLTSLGHLEDAEALIRASIELAPQDGHLYFHLGELRAAQGAADEAIRAYHRSVALDPHYAVARLNLGAVFDESGSTDRALAEYRSALEIDPSYAPAHRNIGGLLVDLGEVDTAVRHLTRALELDADDARTHSNLGNARAKAGDVVAAAESYRRALELDPDLAVAWLGLGNVLAATNDAPASIEAYRTAVKLVPQWKQAHNDLGTQLLEVGDVESAIDSFRRAIEIDPEFSFPQLNLAIALDRQGDLRGAEQSYRRAIEIDPRSAYAHENLAAILRRNGRNPEAVTEYRRALEIDPRRSILRVWIAQAMWGDGDVDGALESVHQALAEDPGLDDAHDMEGILQGSSGELEAAAACFRRAIELAPRKVHHHTNLGFTLQEMGDLSGAIAAYERALQLEPENGSTKEALDALRGRRLP